MIKKKEFIGKETEVVYCGEKFSGRIIDEKKNMLVIQTKDGIKKILKKNSYIQIEDKKIKGDNINKRPEERIKAC